MKKKLKLDGKALRLAHQYEVAWHELYAALPNWKKLDIIDRPDGRCSSELAHDSVLLAEKRQEIEEVQPSGHNI